MPANYMTWGSTASIVSVAADALVLIILVPLLVYQSYYITTHRKFVPQLKRQYHRVCRWLLCPTIVTLLVAHIYGHASVIEALRHIQLYTLMLCVLLWCDSLAHHLQRQSAMTNAQHAADMLGVVLLQRIKWMWALPFVGVLVLDGLRCASIYTGLLDEDDQWYIILDQWSNAWTISVVLAVMWSQWYYMRKMTLDASSASSATLPDTKTALLVDADQLEEDRRASVTPSANRSALPSALNSPTKASLRHLTAAGSSAKRSSGPLVLNIGEHARNQSMSILLTATSDRASSMPDTELVATTQDDQELLTRRQHKGLQLNRHRRSQTAADDMPLPSLHTSYVSAAPAPSSTLPADSQIAQVIAAASNQPRSTQRSTLVSAAANFVSTNAVLLSPRRTTRMSLTPIEADKSQLALHDAAESSLLAQMTNSFSKNRGSTRLQLPATTLNRASNSFSLHSPADEPRAGRQASRLFPSTMIAIDQLSAPNVTIKRLGKSYTFLYLSVALQVVQLAFSVLYIWPELRDYWYVGSGMLMNLGVLGLTLYAWTAKWLVQFQLPKSNRQSNNFNHASTSVQQHSEPRSALRVSHSNILVTPTHRNRSSLELPPHAMVAVGLTEPTVPAHKVLPLMPLPVITPLSEPHSPAATTITQSLQGSYESSHPSSPRKANSYNDPQDPAADVHTMTVTTFSSDCTSEAAAVSSDGVNSRRSTGKSSLRHMQLRLSNVVEDISGEQSRRQSFMITAPTSARASASPRSSSSNVPSSHQPLLIGNNHIPVAAMPVAAATTLPNGQNRKASVFSSIVGRLRKTSLSTVVSSNGKSDTLSTSTQNAINSSQRSSDNAGMSSEQHWQPQVTSTRRNSVAISYDAAHTASMAAASALHSTADFMEAEEAVTQEQSKSKKQSSPTHLPPAHPGTKSASPSRLVGPSSSATSSSALHLIPTKRRSASSELQACNVSPRSKSVSSAAYHTRAHNPDRDSLQSNIASTTHQSQVSQWSFPSNSNQQLHSYSATTDKRSSGTDFLSVSAFSIQVPQSTTSSPTPSSLSRGMSSISRQINLVSHYNLTGKASTPRGGNGVLSFKSQTRDQQVSSDLHNSISG